MNQGNLARNRRTMAHMHPRYSALITRLVVPWLALVVGSCGGGSGENRADQPVPGVEAVQARHGTLPLTQRLSGLVKATNQVAIYPEITAVITEVRVRDGDVVQKGQPLVQLRDKEFHDRLKQANASYQIALAQARQADARLKEVQSELERIRGLADQDIVSPSQLESAETRAAVAEADVDLARARVEQAAANVGEQQENLAQTTVRAPVAGSVGDRNAEVGMLVNTNTQLFTLGQLEKLSVQVVLTDNMLSYIEEGQPAEIFSSNLTAGSLSAPLVRISPFLHPVTHSTIAEIDLDNTGGRLKPGMFVTVDIYYGESEEATLVPMSALYEHPETGTTGVYMTHEALDQEPVVAAGEESSISFTEPVRFEFVPVTVLAQGRMQAGIMGVEPNKWVVTLGQNLLGDEASDARVRRVEWEWAEKLQNLQREDLMQDMLEQKPSF
jgi:HlyD family secretion protein